TLTPASVAANTTAEQTFTVTGLVAGSPVWINKSASFQAGLGIAGVRVSAADTLAINFVNATGSAITPNSEKYIVGNFQAKTPGTGNSVYQNVSQAGRNDGDLTAALRTALAN